MGPSIPVSPTVVMSSTPFFEVLTVTLTSLSDAAASSALKNANSLKLSTVNCILPSTILTGSASAPSLAKCRAMIVLEASNPFGTGSVMVTLPPDWSRLMS